MQYNGLSRYLQARVDGCIRMNSDDDFPIRQALPVGLGFAPGLVGLGFPYEKCNTIDVVNSHTSN